MDEEEQEVKQMDQLDFMDESTKDLKLYYPSRDDPDPIELCYSYMKCLAPEAYVSNHNELLYSISAVDQVSTR